MTDCEARSEYFLASQLGWYDCLISCTVISLKNTTRRTRILVQFRISISCRTLYQSGWERVDSALYNVICVTCQFY